MKKRGIFILAVCFLSIPVLSHAQTTTGSEITGTGGLDLRMRNDGRMLVRSRIPVDANIDYTPYLYKDFRKASIILLKGDTVEGVYKYNIETEALEQSGSDRIIPWNIVKSFTLDATAEDGTKSFSNIKLAWPKSPYGGFIQDVTSSPFVKVKHYLEFIPSNYDPTTDIGSMNDEIKTLSTKYLKVNKKWIEIPNTKGAFYNLFGSYSDPLRKYARKNKLKFKNPEDVGKMVTWVSKRKN